jgi:pSer/pThr/pTyr-binding forkhead associated (FHA) protein
MSFRLTLTQSSEANGGEPVEFILAEPTVTLGRDRTCQIVLSQQAVSRNHARIAKEGQLFFLEDLGSAYGTLVNGKPLPKGERRLLRDGDIIAIAQYDLRFDRVANAPPSDSGEKTSYLARNMVKSAMGDGEERYLVITNGSRSGERIDIVDAQELILGRDEKAADVVLKDDLISRQHVKVRRDWSGTHVEDLNSRNGIKVNRKRVTRQTLKDGDELEVGGVRLVYVCPSEAPEEQSVSVPPSAAEAESSSSPAKPRSGKRDKLARLPTTFLPQEEPRQEPPPEAAEAQEAPAEEKPPEQAPPPAEPPADSGMPDAADAAPYAPPAPLTPLPDEEEVAEEPVPLLKDKGRLVPLVLLGVITLVALGLLIAVFAGA